MIKLLESLEKRLSSLAFPNIVLGIVVAQLIVYALMLIGQLNIESLVLNPFLVVEGKQYWRLVTFIICPPFLAQGAFDALFLGLFWYIFWMMGQHLESAWGTFRFNLYLIAGVFFTLLGTFVGYFLSPDVQVFISPRFLYTSTFLAFAVINPNIEFHIFFILPVKVKWLAWIVGVFAILGIVVQPSWGAKLAALGPFINFLIFFRYELVTSAQSADRRKKHAAQVKALAEEPFHLCTQCGANDRTHPERSFRYKEVDGEPLGICDACREAE
ncbi:MAG: hypothetical protein ACON39_08455 [Coraliomargaritaceae bacterium]